MIYFIQAGAGGPIKIGYTAHSAEERLAALQTGSPTPLTLLGAIPGTLGDESNLHGQFMPEHLYGEWFRASPDLLAHIADATRPEPTNAELYAVLDELYLNMAAAGEPVGWVIADEGDPLIVSRADESIILTLPGSDVAVVLGPDDADELADLLREALDRIVEQEPAP